MKALRSLVRAADLKLAQYLPVLENDSLRSGARLENRSRQCRGDMRGNQVLPDRFVQFVGSFLDLLAKARDLVHFGFSVGGLTAPMVDGGQPGVESGCLSTTPGGRHE